MPRFAVVFCLLLWGLTILPSSASAEVIQKPEFSLTLPDGWVEIPQEVLEQKYEETMRMAPNLAAVRFEYGFQRGPVQDYIDLPGVMIDVSSDGRPSIAELRSSLAVDMNKKFQDKRDTEYRGVPSMEYNQWGYDARSHVLSMESRCEVPVYGTVSQFTKIIPTEEGTVNFYFSTPVSEEADNLPVLQKIFGSIVISPEIEYRERWLDSYWYLGRPSNIVKTSILLVFGCSFLVFRMHQRRSLKSAEGTQQ